MKPLRRQNGIVSIEPYCVGFPMRAGTFTNITCIQTLAGFQKILGGKDVTSQELRVVFQENREGCEALANLLYEADVGEPVVLSFHVEPIENPD
jgi:hypothetical protein